jgi:hypothetical protein
VGVLALKLLLAPAFVVAASLVGRRFGSRVGGIVGGLPVVAGPILLVLALTHDRAFAAEATAASVLGLVSLAAFVVVYAAVVRRVAWPVALGAATATFLGGTAVLSLLDVGPWPALAAAYVALAVALVVVPRPRPGAVAGGRRPAWDLPMRAVVAAAMVVTLTAVSGGLGPELSGLLSPFPIITSILAAFTQAQRGPEATLTLLRGMLAGFYVYATVVFLFALALA